MTTEEGGVDILLDADQEAEYPSNGTELRSLEQTAYRYGYIKAVQRFKAKITSGELMVVKTAKMKDKGKAGGSCSECNDWLENGSYFCSNCGAKIIEG